MDVWMWQKTITAVHHFPRWVKSPTRTNCRLGLMKHFGCFGECGRANAINKFQRTITTILNRNKGIWLVHTGHMTHNIQCALYQLWMFMLNFCLWHWLLESNIFRNLYAVVTSDEQTQVKQQSTEVGGKRSRPEGPRLWFSGQHPCLRYQWSEFKSRWSQLKCCVVCLNCCLWRGK